jgi:dipeptidyl aminopeptidase/acylaminoacyl peptidase
MSKRSCFLGFWGLTLLAIPWVLPAGGQTFTIESVMKSPFPSNLVASPQGHIVGWVFYDEGKRNIWIAEGPEYEARQLTAYSEDDGQEMGDLAFSADGALVFFVRGGDANSSGEYPNPTSSPEGGRQAVWAVRAAGGEPFRIGEGTDPVPSPADQRVAYILKGQIYVATVNDKPEPKLLFKARGTCRRPAWSPDGTKLAFVSSRRGHSFIGIYDFSKASVRWISPSVDQDANPAFSPDGTKLAFFRFPGEMDSPSFSEGRSFELMMADISTGQAKSIWQSPDESGGFAQYYASSPLRWADGGRLLFYSEHEGWMRVYSLPAEGGVAMGLTPGASEVEDSVLSPDGKTLIFSSNSTDIDRRHLWKAPVAGGEPKILTPGAGIEWAPVCPDGGQDIVFLCSAALQPAAPAVLGLASGKRRLVAPRAIPQDFPAGLVEPQPVVFKAGDGLEIHGQLFLPSGSKPGDKRPAVIFMHGGPIRQMLLGWHMRGYYHNAYAFNQFLANSGYVVLSVNYRLGIGQGRAFRTAPNGGYRGASEYQDIVAAGKFLQARPEVDPKKIGLWGGSYGGYLTALGLARDSELFAAGVDLHGVHDWALRWRAEDRSSGSREEEMMRTAYDSSPVADVRFWSSPVLMVHGDDDRNVEFLQTIDLVQRLRREGKAHVETLVFPDEVHSFLLHRRWLEVFSAAADFFGRFLRNSGT